MYEYKMLANLLTVYSSGTDQQHFLTDLGIDSTHLAADTMGPYVVFRPFLKIPRKLCRDYNGFRVDFREGRVVAISPTGPQPYANIVEVDIKEFLNQRMSELNKARIGTQRTAEPGLVTVLARCNNPVSRRFGRRKR